VNIRRIVRIVLFASLAATPVCAILGVFIMESWAWKLTGSAGLSVFVAGVWAAVMWREQERFTPLQVSIMAGSAMAAACFLGEIWDVMPGGMQLWFTAWLVLAAVVATAPALKLMAIPSMRPAALATVVVQAIGLGMWGSEIWSLTSWRSAPAAGTVLVIGALVLCANLAVRKEERSVPGWAARNRWRILGAGATIVTLGAWVWAIDHEFSGAAVGSYWNRTNWTWVVLLSTLAVVLGMGNVLRMAKGPPWVRWVHLAVIGATVLQGGLLAWSVYQPWGSSDVEQRAVFALWVVVATGLITSTLLDRWARARTARNAHELTEIRLECPACRSRQSMALGGGACRNCGLEIHVSLKQNKCFECGYSLAGIAPEGACPECGCALSKAASLPTP
jgi:hypothetical protein